MKYPLFTAYYTPSYAPYKERLERSLKERSLPYQLTEVQDLGSWEENCRFKPEFLERELVESKEEAICYIDADAEIVSDPILLQEVNEDVAFVFFMAHQREKRILLKEEFPKEALSPFFQIDALKMQMKSGGALYQEFAPQIQTGLLYLKRKESVLELMKNWKELAKEFPKALDGELFQRAIKKSAVSIRFLPITYCSIKGLTDSLTDVPPVILQHQASREMR